MEIRVGITTDGAPHLRTMADGTTLLENQRIGCGFHWQRTLMTYLPGKVEAGGPCLVINTLPIETYLRCVVGSEMNPAAPIDFLKAHAIISRTWVLKLLSEATAGPSGAIHHCSASPGQAPGLIGQLPPPAAQLLNTDEISDRKFISWEDHEDHAADCGFDVCADDHCQRYQGLQPISHAAEQAIAETDGLVLVDADGNIADARFSKCCGGRTEIFSTCWQDLDLPYLHSIPDPHCDLSRLPETQRQTLLEGILKDYDLDTEDSTELWGEWQKEISSDSIRRMIMLKYQIDIGEVIALEPIERGPSGRIKLLRITGDRDAITIGKELTIRRLLARDCLKSSNFTAEVSDRRIRLRGRGWGHGVGLCQIGAARMAADGADFREILSFYYPGTIIQKL